MALKAVLENLDDVPDTARDFYKEFTSGDKKLFQLSIEGVDDHPTVANLKSAYERVKADKVKLTNDLRDATTKVGGIPDDFDVTEWDRLKAEDEARKSDPDNKNVRSQIDAATAAVEARYKAQLDREKQAKESALADKDGVITELEGQFRQILVRDGLKGALISAGVKKGLIDAAVAKFERDAEVVVEDGMRVARMKADLGGEEISKYIANWSQGDEAKDFITPLKGADENGSSRSGNLNTDGNPYSKNGWNKTAQGALVQSNRARAEQLAKAAGFKNLEATFVATGPITA